MACTAERHGNQYAYRVYGCRCPDVAELMRAKWRADSRIRQVRGGPNKVPRVRSQQVDEVAVARAMAGDAVPLTIRERGEAVARLTRQGLSLREIALRLRLSQRSVSRHRSGHVKYGRELSHLQGDDAA